MVLVQGYDGISSRVLLVVEVIRSRVRVGFQGLLNGGDNNCVI